LIILFNGPPGSGKDAGAEILKEIGFKHLSFKDELFKETCNLFNVNIEWFMNGYNDRIIKEKKVSELKNMSRREALIYTSEKYIKPKYGKGYFGLISAKKIEKGKDYVFSDCGFYEEVLEIINTNEIVKIVQLTRYGTSFVNDSRKYLQGNLVSEYILGYKTPISKDFTLSEKLPVDIYLVHNNSTLDDLKYYLTELFKKEKNGFERTKK
jgi:hypothetical protein